MVKYWQIKDGERINDVSFLVELDSLPHDRYENDNGVKIMRADTQSITHWYLIKADGERIDTTPMSRVLTNYERENFLAGYTRDIGRSSAGFTMELVR